MSIEGRAETGGSEGRDAGENIPRIHRLADLLGQVDQDTRDGLAPHIASIRALDRFYIPTRYPDTLVGPLSEALPGQQEAKTALGVAKVTTRIAGELLGP